MKETLTDKLMKRFYGITGPLDEYRKQEINRIGNLSFIYLFYTILFANVIAIIISKKYPDILIWAYPLFITVALFVIFMVVSVTNNFDIIQPIDVEELDEKEKVQMKHLGWKSGSLFGIFMWLSGPLIMNLDYPNGLIAPKVLFFGLMCGLTFGLLIQLLAKARQK